MNLHVCQCVHVLSSLYRILHVHPLECTPAGEHGSLNVCAAKLNKRIIRIVSRENIFTRSEKHEKQLNGYSVVLQFSVFVELNVEI